MSEGAAAAGLAGVVAGETAISTVGVHGKGLTYCGYSIHELAEQASFEEVAYLLVYGSLPTQTELTEYRGRLRRLRALPESLRTVLEQLPATAHPMDVLRTGCSALGCLEPEHEFTDEYRVADRLLATFPGMLLTWYWYHRDGRRLDTEGDEDSIAGYFLRLLTGAAPSDLHRRAM